MKKVSSVREIYRLSVGDKTYSFRLSFMCWLRLEERYGTNAAFIVDNFILGIERMKNMMRILSCACVEEDISAEELSDEIEFTPQNLEVLGEIALCITGLDKKSDNEVKKNDDYKPPKQDEHIVDYDFFYTVAKSYLGYSHQEFWYEANPYEVIETWNKYVSLNGWDKKSEDDTEEEKDYYTIDDL